MEMFNRMKYKLNPKWYNLYQPMFIEDLKEEIDVNTFIKQLKNIKKMWSDSGMECPIYNKDQKLWVHGKSNCYYCEINKLSGSTFD